MLTRSQTGTPAWARVLSTCSVHAEAPSHERHIEIGRALAVCARACASALTGSTPFVVDSPAPGVGVELWTHSGLGFFGGGSNWACECEPHKRCPFLCMVDAVNNGGSRVVIAVHAMRVDGTLALTLHSCLFCGVLCPAQFLRYRSRPTRPRWACVFAACARSSLPRARLRPRPHLGHNPLHRLCCFGPARAV